MDYEFYKFDRKICLSKDKYPCIELAFFEIFKLQLMDDKKMAELFLMYSTKYHKNYNFINYTNDCFVSVLLELSSRELHLSQQFDNTSNGLDYDYNESIFFGRMVGDFLIRNKDISVINHKEKKVLTACFNWTKYFNKEWGVDNTYQVLSVAPIKTFIRDDRTVAFKRTIFPYRNSNYIYEHNDMCSYLGGYPDKKKVFKKGI